MQFLKTECFKTKLYCKNIFANHYQGNTLTGKTKDRSLRIEELKCWHKQTCRSPRTNKREGTKHLAPFNKIPMDSSVLCSEKKNKWMNILR